MSALRMLVILAARVGSISVPLASTGLAAPMLVLGDMAATCAARVMKVPALPARAPAGAT